MLKKFGMIVAAVAATALAFSSPAHAGPPGPIDKILVGGVEQDAYVTGMSKGALNVVVTTASGPMNLSCTGAELEGQVKSPPLPVNRWLIIDKMTFGDCDGPGGNLMSVSVVCPLIVDYDDGNIVTDDLVDQIAGTAYMTNPDTGQHCIQAKDKITNGFLCSFSIGGEINATFDETPKPWLDPEDEDTPTSTETSYQDLTISGPGLTVQNASCLGQVANGNEIALTATFNIDVDDAGAGDYWNDLINFVPAP